MSDFYAYTDKALKYLRRYYITEFNRAKMQIRADELNVISISKQLYERISAETERVFRLIAKCKYKEIAGEDFIIGMWLSGLLGESNPLTGYIWKNDIDRKRQYFTESIMSGEPIDKAAKKALRYWYTSQKAYADYITDAASMQAFEDTGAEYVRYIAVDDMRTCHECWKRHGKIYPLASAPDIPRHHNCRCHYERVR